MCNVDYANFSTKKKINESFSNSLKILFFIFHELYMNLYECFLSKFFWELLDVTPQQKFFGFIKGIWLSKIFREAFNLLNIIPPLKNSWIYHWMLIFSAASGFTKSQDVYIIQVPKSIGSAYQREAGSTTWNFVFLVTMGPKVQNSNISWLWHVSIHVKYNMKSFWIKVTSNYKIVSSIMWQFY